MQTFVKDNCLYLEGYTVNTNNLIPGGGVGFINLNDTIINGTEKSRFKNVFRNIYKFPCKELNIILYHKPTNNIKYEIIIYSFMHKPTFYKNVKLSGSSEPLINVLIYKCSLKSNTITDGIYAPSNITPQTMSFVIDISGNCYILRGF